MLTGLDFPQELLYAADGLWVRDDRARAVRVGLHAAALDGAGPVVHVELPRSGTAVGRGEAIGHIDLDGAAIPIFAPVTGTVFVPNPDLRTDPDRARRDPYGAGYLLDMEDVDPTELDALMDAEEAMLAYSEVEADGAPRARVVQERDRPWFTSLTFELGDRVLARARLLPPLANELFAPDWQVGQTWSVRAVAAGVERHFDYEVLGEARVGGEEVTRVRAAERQPGPDGVPSPTRILYFRTASFTLTAWDEIPPGSAALFRRHWNERGEAAYLHAGPEDGFFYDHPLLPPGRFDRTRELPPTATLPALIEHCRFRGGGAFCEAELRADVPNELGVPERLFSRQVWEAGRPWWTEAVRMRGDKVLVKATLTVSGGGNG